MFGRNSKSIGAIMAVVLALAFMLMPVAQVNAQSTGITEAVENVGLALSGMVEGLTNTLSSDFIMSIVESISMRIGRVFGAGLFVASTDNIFFRVLEWIVGFTIVIVTEIIWLILDLIYIIPVVSCVAGVTQLPLAHGVFIPLIFNLPSVFGGNTDTGLHWANYGSAGCAMIWALIGELATPLSFIGHLAYAILMVIPLLNILVAIVAFLIAIFFMPIGDLLMVLMSAYSCVLSVIPSTITDCVIIARAMCRACLGV